MGAGSGAPTALSLLTVVLFLPSVSLPEALEFRKPFPGLSNAFVSKWFLDFQLPRFSDSAKKQAVHAQQAPSVPSVLPPSVSSV